jgi:hypothetical protein
MSFNINNFKSNIQGFGYLPSNKFEVYLRPPDVMLNNAVNNQGTETEVSQIIKLIKFRAEDVKVPGIALQTADVARYGIGTTQKMPFNAQFNEIGLTMLSDGYGDLWRFGTIGSEVFLNLTVQMVLVWQTLIDQQHIQLVTKTIILQ